MNVMLWKVTYIIVHKECNYIHAVGCRIPPEQGQMSPLYLIISLWVGACIPLILPPPLMYQSLGGGGMVVYLNDFA